MHWIKWAKWAKWIKSISREAFGLVVDDGSFALAILLWLILVRLMVPHLRMIQNEGGVILFVGLAMILVESTIRYSRRRP